MKKIKFKNIKAVWTALDKGHEVFWVHDGYKLYIEKDNLPESNRFGARDGKILCIRCIENYFGGIMDKSELNKLFCYRAKS